ncbi:MAG: RNA polymerase sigma factor [Micromonosporaceae bacterium]
MAVSGGPAAPAPDEPTAFADWVRPHLRPMTLLAARLAPYGDRDDVVQEALARAWAKRHLYDPTRGTAITWLLAITADQARKAVRRSRPIAVLSDEPDPRADRPEVWLDVERAVRRLAPQQRLAVNCYYFVGLTVAQTATVMGCAEGTVKSTLADARARLRPLLEVSE